MHRAVLVFQLPVSTAQAIHAALLPESSTGEVPKTRASATLEGDIIRIEIEADDLSSLRAALNSHLRWMDAAQKAAAIGSREDAFPADDR